MPTENPLRILVITSRPLTDGAGNPITRLDVEEERRRIRVALAHARVAVQAHFLPHATTGAVKTALRAARKPMLISRDTVPPTVGYCSKTILAKRTRSRPARRRNCSANCARTSRWYLASPLIVNVVLFWRL